MARHLEVRTICLTATQLMPVLPRVLLEKPERDATTEAVLRYFEAERNAGTGSAADHRQHADAFDHLVAICYGWTLAMRNKKTGVFEGRYFVRDRYGSLTHVANKMLELIGLSGPSVNRVSAPEPSLSTTVAADLPSSVSPCPLDSAVRDSYLGRSCCARGW